MQMRKQNHRQKPDIASPSKPDLARLCKAPQKKAYIPDRNFTFFRHTLNYRIYRSLGFSMKMKISANHGNSQRTDHNPMRFYNFLCTITR